MLLTLVQVTKQANLNMGKYFLESLLNLKVSTSLRTPTDQSREYARTISCLVHSFSLHGIKAIFPPKGCSGAGGQSISMYTDTLNMGASQQC